MVYKHYRWITSWCKRELQWAALNYFKAWWVSVNHVRVHLYVKIIQLLPSLGLNKLVFLLRHSLFILLFQPSDYIGPNCPSSPLADPLSPSVFACVLTCSKLRRRCRACLLPVLIILWLLLSVAAVVIQKRERQNHRALPVNEIKIIFRNLKMCGGQVLPSPWHPCHHTVIRRKHSPK